MIESEDEARSFVAARCTPSAYRALETLVERLSVENDRQNLVSQSSLERVWTRHIADSAQLLDLAKPGTGPWLDLGTGAGFPGLVIAIMRPDLPVHLVESRRLRSEWLAHAQALTGAKNVRIHPVSLERVESFSASIVSARAFAPLDKLLSLAMRFSTADTLWLLPKGRSTAQEVARLPIEMRRMFHVEPSHTDADSGIVVGRLATGT